MASVTYVEIQADLGESIGQAKQEALGIALNEWRNVKLIHNERIYILHVNDLILAFKEETKKEKQNG